MSSLDSLVSGGTHGSMVLRRENALLRTRIRMRSRSLAAFLCSGLSLWNAADPSSSSSDAWSLRLRPIVSGERRSSDYERVAELACCNGARLSFAFRRSPAFFGYSACRYVSDFNIKVVDPSSAFPTTRASHWLGVSASVRGV